ncbi:unnamed protein product [Diatraea saccharalis]|uniref:Protein CNPPD1 n=1 Tax=Diatraea saccharalis TaxID=40085 RepID=A0A9N9W8S4_9NEOP|nr:unnamed protein product [Diatraea saccharalis]
MSNISKRKEGSKAKIKSMGNHQEFLKRITKTLYYGELPTLPCLSLPVTEISCEVWSVSQRGRSLRRLHADAAAGLARSACVSPCALVLALLYLERLNACNPDYIAATAPADLFLVSLMVGNKFLQDDGEDDEVICSEWAASGGIELAQLKKLELEFLNAIDWNVFVSEKSFEAGLRRLERRVALKQARLRGFFTYTDLAAAGAPPLLDLCAALALALTALASTLALLASAPLLTRLAASSLASLSRPPASPLSGPTPPLHANVSPADPEPPSLGNLTLDDPSPSDRLRCCTTWATYRDRVSEAPPRRAPPRNFFDGLVLYDWKSFEPWWSRTSVLNWLYQSSLVDPMRRWLEKVDGFAAVGRGPAPDSCRGCVRQWLNLSKLNVLVASVSDY